MSHVIRQIIQCDKRGLASAAKLFLLTFDCLGVCVCVLRVAWERAEGESHDQFKKNVVPVSDGPFQSEHMLVGKRKKEKQTRKINK